MQGNPFAHPTFILTYFYLQRSNIVLNENSKEFVSQFALSDNISLT